MHAAPKVCPVCSDDLIITRLDCRNCETSLSGTFEFRGLSHLKPEQLVFVETFIRCEGKFNRMEKVMELSYPTLRARLHEIIRELGYTVGEQPVDKISEEERSQILDRIATGELTAEAATEILAGQPI